MPSSLFFFLVLLWKTRFLGKTHRLVGCIRDTFDWNTIALLCSSYSESKYSCWKGQNLANRSSGGAHHKFCPVSVRGWRFWWKRVPGLEANSRMEGAEVYVGPRAWRLCGTWSFKDSWPSLVRPLNLKVLVGNLSTRLLVTFYTMETLFDFTKSVLSPDVILCGWLGSKHQLTS